MTMPILTVDDESDMAASYARLLRRQGYRVVCVGSRAVGLQAMESQPFRLVIANPGCSSLSPLRPRDPIFRFRPEQQRLVSWRLHAVIFACTAPSVPPVRGCVRGWPSEALAWSCGAAG